METAFTFKFTEFQPSNVFLFADDTSILVTEKIHCALKHKVVDTLSLFENWFIANKLVLNTRWFKYDRD
jgi:hypothetical protein